MKVILTQDVEKLGGAHEVVEVAAGYANNYLLPRSIAIVASKGAMANLDNMRRAEERRQVRLRGTAETLATQLEGKTLVIPARAGSAGRLYGSVGNADIAKQIQQDWGLDIDRRQIVLAEPIRSTGVYTIPVALHRDVQVPLTVQVGDAVEAAAAPGDSLAAPAAQGA